MLAAGVRARRDVDELRFLAALPTGKRQADLLLAAVQYLYGTPSGADDLRDVVTRDGDRVAATMCVRAPQTERAVPDGRQVARRARHRGWIGWRDAA